MEVARTMMFDKNVPKHFLGDVVVTACYLINRLPTKCLKDISPYKVLNKIKTSIDFLKVFGCVCYVHIPDDQRNKQPPKSIKCIFIGYSTTRKSYKCYNPEMRKTFVHRDVKFDEEKGFDEEKDWNKLKDLCSSGSDLAASLRSLLENLNIPTHKDVLPKDAPSSDPTQPSPPPQSEEKSDNSETEKENDKEESQDGEEATVTTQDHDDNPDQNDEHFQDFSDNSTDQESNGSDESYDSDATDDVPHMDVRLVLSVNIATPCSPSLVLFMKNALILFIQMCGLHLVHLEKALNTSSHSLMKNQNLLG